MIIPTYGSMEGILSLLCLFLWPPYGIGRAIIFLSCGFFFFYLLCSFSLAYSQPPQIECLPYFHTWCGLVRIYDAGLKRAARGSLKIQDQKFAICAPSHNFVGRCLRN